ncbi:MAG: AAA family ATPase [Actinomyces sp.]|nr:MAG: AAA family ATPase [Actinomyces sp.]
MSFSPPAWARRLEQADRALLFLDELTTCSAAVQAAMLRIIQERVAGDMALGEHVRIVAAANPPDQAVLGIDLDPPMLNRFTHVTWEIDLAAWGEWVLSQPSLAPDRAPEVRSKILGFLEFRPGLVVSVPEDPGTNQPWPSLRSWYGAMVQLEADPDDDAFVHDTLRGTVGEAAAVEFTAWSTESELPRPADVLADPKVVRWEELRPDQAFAVMTGLRGLLGARRRVARRDWEAAIRVLDVAAAAGRADVGVPLLRWLFERVPKDARIPASLKEHYLELLQMARLVPG